MANDRVFSIEAFLVTSLGLLGASAPEHLFDAALNDIASTSPIPIYLPRAIPDVVDAAQIKYAKGGVVPDGYKVTLYYEMDIGNAGFAGVIAGSTSKVNDNLLSNPNIVKVKLSNGSPAWFRPVSCGGSCAPANLWWNIGNHGYQIQLKMRSDLPQQTQLKSMIQMADSVQLEPHAG